jgi:hypothetical protein
MDAVTENQWNDWAQLLIKRAIDEHDELMVDAIVEYVLEQIKAVREELAALRADIAIHSGLARAEIADLKKRSSNAPRGRTKT